MPVLSSARRGVNMRRRTSLMAALGALVLGSTVLSGWTGANVAVADDHRPTVTAASCAQLIDFAVAAKKIGLPTTGADVTSAQWVDESGGQCRVIGDIHPVDQAAPPIEFEVNL